MPSGEYVTQVADEASQIIDAFQQTVAASLEGSVPGMREPTPQELAAFFFHQQVLFPPEPFTMPDGSVVNTSPWVLMLGLPECENGKEYVDKFMGYVRRNGGA